MNQYALNKPSKNYDPPCGDLTIMAEQELAAFFSAVNELFGPEQAKVSAQDWLHELMAIDDLPPSTRQWRLLTVKVSARLASRVNTSSMSIASRNTPMFRPKGSLSEESQPRPAQARVWLE